MQIELVANHPSEFFLKGEGQKLRKKQYFFMATFTIASSENGTFFAYDVFNEGWQPPSKKK
ncbi:MAG: hypothetical protein D6732_21640 [Methanobacteriota archaeon]|nr:MAG: hypothetical protein D6732_21640 [Euryarchaeota archaeon]